jgi:hypothetical protein
MSQAAAAFRYGSDPADDGYPRSTPEPAMASMTAVGGGSQGVPTEQSTRPPRPANFFPARPARTANLS